MASTGTSALFFARYPAHARGIGFAIVAVGPMTARPLQLMQFTAVLGVHSTLDDALTALNATRDNLAPIWEFCASGPMACVERLAKVYVATNRDW